MEKIPKVFWISLLWIMGVAYLLLTLFLFIYSDKTGMSPPKTMLVSAWVIIFLVVDVLMALSVVRFVLNIFKVKR